MVLVFKGIAPPSQFPATVASGAPPKPNHACCEAGVHVCFETLWRRGGGGFATRALSFFNKKKSLRALRAHNMRMHYARTPVVHQVHQRAVCPSWGSPPWGLKKWVMEGEDMVVELRKVMKAALRALVHRSPRRHWTNRLLDGFSSFWPREVRPGVQTLHHPCILGNPQTKGDRIRIACLSRTFWGAHKLAEMLRHPCIIGVHTSNNSGSKSPSRNFAELQ